MVRHQAGPAQDGDGLLASLAAVGEKLLLGDPALLPQAMKLDRVQFAWQTLRDVVRQRGIDVVAPSRI